jgi:hypothetical protein
MVKPRRLRTNGAAKNKPPEESLLNQLSVPLRDFVKDFKAHGAEALQQVRERNPEKYLELSAKLAGLVANTEARGPFTGEGPRQGRARG